MPRVRSSPIPSKASFRRSVENLRKVLLTAGSDLAHVVQTRNYVRDDVELPLFNQLYREYFSAPFPARTTITNCPARLAPLRNRVCRRAREAITSVLSP